MTEIDSSVELGFKLGAGLGETDPMLRQVVGLKRRCDEDAGVPPGPGFARETTELSNSMYNSVLMAAIDLEKPQQPAVASVRRSDWAHSRLRRRVELDDILVDPNYPDRDVLTGVMIALNCQGRSRFRPIAANINPAHEGTAEVLSKLGFERDENMSGIQIYTDVPPEDHYTLGAGQLAIHRATRLPGGRDMLRQAQQNLDWN